MSEKIQLEDIIPENLMGMRIDQALAKMFPEYSRGQLTKWLKAGDVLVNGQLLKPKESIQGGEKVTIGTELQVQDESWQAESIALDIIYEDDDVIIAERWTVSAQAAGPVDTAVPTASAAGLGVGAAPADM